jgi:hypothetical protein
VSLLRDKILNLGAAFAFFGELEECMGEATKDEVAVPVSPLLLARGTMGGLDEDLVLSLLLFGSESG